MWRAVAALALLVAFVLLASPAAGKAKKRELKRLPRIFGLRFNVSLKRAKAILKRRGVTITRENEKLTNTFGKAATEVRLEFSPKKPDKITRARAYFFNGGLARIKIYGPGAKKIVAAKLPKPTVSHRRYDYWLNKVRMWAVRCREQKCELFDMGVLIRRKAASREKTRQIYNKLMTRLDR